MKTSADRIQELIEEATVDAYDEEEQFAGFFTMIEDNVKTPFQTTSGRLTSEHLNLLA